MPFVLIVSGSVLLICAVRNTQQGLFWLINRDFTGANNFGYWFLSIMIIGAIGYIPKMKPISDGFLILVILTLFLRKGGFFDQFQKAVGTTQTAAPVAQSAAGAGDQFADIGGSFGGATWSVGTGGAGGTVQVPVGGGGTVSVNV